VRPVWKSTDIRNITKPDVIALGRSIIERTGKKRTAGLTLSLLSTLFNWCINEGLLDRNPAQRVANHVVENEGKVRRDRVLSDPELASVWHAATRLRVPWGPFFKMLILTGQRLNEVAGMRWDEVGVDDDGEALWTVPARRMKNKKAHTVPLSPQALDVLASVRPVDTSARPYVFSTRGGAGPIRSDSFAKDLMDRWLTGRVEQIEYWRIHDLRRTVSAGMAKKLRVSPFVIDAVQSHTVKGVSQVFTTYVPNYDPINEKREALCKWGECVLAVAERYQPAPTEEELRQERLRAMMRRAWKREEAAARRQGKPGRPKTLEEADALALAAMAETAARRR
jgi:integrase